MDIQEKEEIIVIRTKGVHPKIVTEIVLKLARILRKWNIYIIRFADNRYYEALKQRLENVSNVKILLNMSELKSKYQSLEMQILGKVSHKNVIKLHEKSWALILPSITEEPLPYVVVEAMTLVTIPVASSVEGVPEIVGDCPAKKFLFKPGDVNDLIEKLKILTLQSEENILSLATECKNHIIEIFNKENIERKIVGMFKELLN